MAEAVDRLIHDMDGIPNNLRKNYRPKLRYAARLVADDAKRRASWSTRIPRAIRVNTVKAAGVSVTVNTRLAPHAGPYEGLNGDPFRHPVFGNRRVWVSQRARPFLAPALDAQGGNAERLIGQAIDKTTRDAGFH